MTSVFSLVFSTAREADTSCSEKLFVVVAQQGYEYTAAYRVGPLLTKRALSYGISICVFRAHL